jgi:uncharacterized protein
MTAVIGLSYLVISPGRLVMPHGLDPLNVIDRYLMSDRAPENSMGLSDLDGFLTGIVVGPELIMPSEWLPVIWGNDQPNFKDDREAQAVISAIMDRYNEIVQNFQAIPPEFGPVLWETKDGLTIAADWAEGFNDAIKLRPQALMTLIDDERQSDLLRPVMVLCGSEEHQSREAEAELMRKATDELIGSIIGIYRYWHPR